MFKLPKPFATLISDINALIIYDNFLSLVTANATLLDSAQHANLAMELNIRPWRADLLRFPPTADEALADASHAHLIMFVGRCAQSPPFWLQDWLERWVKSRQIKDVTLVVILEESIGSHPTSTKPELSRFARRHGPYFMFSRAKAITAPSIDGRSMAGERGRESQPSRPAIEPAILDDKIRNAYRGWCGMR